MSNSMYTLTKAMQGVFVEPRMVDASNNKSGPSFTELNRLEDFWQVDTLTLSYKASACVLLISTWRKSLLLVSFLKAGTMKRMSRTTDTSCTRIDCWALCNCVRRKLEITRASSPVIFDKKSNSASTPTRPPSKISIPSDLVKISTERTARWIREYRSPKETFLWMCGRCFSRFRYTPSTSLFGFRTTGKVGVYDQGGFIKTSGSSQEEFINEIGELKDKWVSSSAHNCWHVLNHLVSGLRVELARFWLISLFTMPIWISSVKSSELWTDWPSDVSADRCFSLFRLLFEFPPVGGLVTSSKFRAVKLIRYVNAFDYFVLGCEILFMLFIVYYTIEEVLEVSSSIVPRVD